MVAFMPVPILALAIMLIRLAQRALRPSFSPRPRFNSTHLGSKPKSRHASFYSDTVPAMIPVFLLGSAIYLGLRLGQMTLLHERYVEEAESRIKQLEDSITSLEATRRSAEHVQPLGTPEKEQRGPGWRLW